MIHDAILFLCDYPCGDRSEAEQDFNEHVRNLSDAEKIFFRNIIKIAKLHGHVRHFIKKYSFISKRNNYSKYSNIHSGLFTQVLAEGMDEVLEPYKLHVIQLQKQIFNNPHLSLSYVLGSVEKFKFLFQTLNKIIFSIKEEKSFGCQILSVLQRHILTGDKETTIALQKLSQKVHEVFFEKLSNWILYGEIDSKNDFIIQELSKPKFCSPGDTTKGSSTKSNNLDDFSRTIENEYEINATMLPYYIPISLAQKILFIGKSIVLFDSNPFETKQKSLLIFSKNDSTKRFTIWGTKEHKFHKNLQELKKSPNFDVYKLDLLINEIKLCVTEHLWVVAGEEAGVLHELQLMKDFYLLGRGELFLELLRLASPILDSSASSVSTRDINVAFNTAARAVLLGANKDIEKFKFKIPYNKPNSSVESFSNTQFISNNNWSTVILEYDVKWPLHLIFTTEVLDQYNEMFRFLLRLKKAQHDLHLMWYTFKKTKNHRSSVWQLHNKLMFLLDHLQHYLQADVLESNYSKLKNEAEKIKDFELLKSAHHTFLINILSQAFLLMTAKSHSSAEEYQSNPVMSNILEIIKLCDNVCSVVHERTNQEREEYLIAGYATRFELLVGKLLQLLTALRTQPCGMHLARLLMRLDFNRWFSSTAHLTQSVSYML